MIFIKKQPIRFNIRIKYLRYDTLSFTQTCRKVGKIDINTDHVFYLSN